MKKRTWMFAFKSTTTRFVLAFLVVSFSALVVGPSQAGAECADCDCHLAAGCDSCCDSGCDGIGGCDTSCGCLSCEGLEKCELCQSLARIRKSFADCGITMENNVTQFYMGTPSGGLNNDWGYARHGDYVMNFDFGKMGIQEGLFLKLRAEHRMGDSVSQNTGALMPATVAADLPVSDSEHVYLTNVLLTQALSENFILFAGKMDTLDGDMNAFAHGRGIRQFSNMAFVSSSIALRTVPYSTLGAGFAFLHEGSPLLTFLVLNATDTANSSGFSELFANGVTLLSELRVPTNFFGLPGHQLLGGTWSSRKYVSFGQDPRIVLPNIPVAEQDGSWSLYWNCDQYLVADSQNPKRGWGYFARAGIADQGANPIGYFLSAGLGGSSPIACRKADSFGVGYYYSGTSDKVGALLEAVAGPIGDGQGIEMFYNVALTRAITLTPDLQYLSQARENVDDAFVAGARMNIAF
ncbi:carbohydrate porin [Rosistilla oblonga]|uniref:carbohydrate porin n=1 Tax=Rosistilla oblonga TaxID=2527990 RepID=UPI003A9748FD